MARTAQTDRIHIQCTTPHVGMAPRVRVEPDDTHPGLYWFTVSLPANAADGRCYTFHHPYRTRSLSDASRFLSDILAAGTINPTIWTQGHCWGDVGNVSEAAMVMSELFPDAASAGRDPAPHCIHEAPPHRNSKRPTR